MNRSAYRSQLSHVGVAVHHPTGGEAIAEALARASRTARFDKYGSDDCRRIPTDVADHDRDLEQFRDFVVIDAKAKYDVVVFAMLAV